MTTAFRSSRLRLPPAGCPGLSRPLAGAYHLRDDLRKQTQPFDSIVDGGGALVRMEARQPDFVSAMV